MTIMPKGTTERGAVADAAPGRAASSSRWRCATGGSRAGPDWPTERPPRPLPARDVSFPPYQMRTLPNGLQVIAVSHHEQPAVSLRLIVRAGGAQDPADKPGVAYVAAALLDQGTTTKSAEQIASDDRLDRRRDRRRRRQRPHVHQRRGDEGQPRASRSIWSSDLARNPAFAPEEIDRQRQQILSGPEGQLRRSRLPGRRGVRSAGLRLPSVREAGFRHARIDCRGHARGSARVPQALVWRRTTPFSRSSAT